MLKTQFKDHLDFDIYLEIQKIRQEKGYLTVSERNQLKSMLEKNYKPTFIKEEKPKLPIITDINFLRQPCAEVTEEDNIKEIIQKLRDTLEGYDGYALSAPQIGIYKKISYCKIPYYNQNNKKLEEKEVILINPKIIEHDRKIIIKQEGCLSIPNLRIDTNRWVFITLINHNEKFEPQTFMSQDLEGLILQHEIDHLNGKLIIDRKHVDINYRKK
jgi:peptide deformylase